MAKQKNNVNRQLKLSKEQKKILKQSSVLYKHLTEERMLDIARHPLHVKTLSEDDLVEFLRITNALYRGGYPLLSDADYDGIYLQELKKRNPNHDYLQSVEPESGLEGPKVDLPVPMLSTEKGTSIKDIERWRDRVKKAAKDIGVDAEKIQVRVSPKLDGFAAYDDGKIFYTRGDGRRGTDITRVFRRGLAVVGGDRGMGAGEIVVDKEYFEKNLSMHFENTRNFQSTIIREKELEPYIEDAIRDKAVVFYPFAKMESWLGSIDSLIPDFDNIIQNVWKSVKYDVDGVVLEIIDPNLKQYMDMGSTAPHHKWQIAYKINQEKALVRVLAVTPQTSRSGRITPVAELEPTKLSGVTISRATAHHYGMVKKKGIGKGAVIELIRSGMVIPKIENVIEKAKPDIPSNCPSCNAELLWDSDNLICPNVGYCPAQIKNTIEHFFMTLRNINGFGESTISKLYDNGLKDVCSIYHLTESKFQEFGFGEKQSQNLVRELERSRNENLEDWRFLAAFGIHRLGMANCEQLLKHVKLSEIFDLTVDKIVANKIFAMKTAEIMVKGLKAIKSEFDCVIEVGFNLEYSKLLSELRVGGQLSQISGKQVVFTGTMKHGSRENMERQARLLGAKVGSAVSGRTDYLVTGLDVGQKKIDTARSKNVSVITEDEYFDLIK
jgi:DNA ligase (NAD+)